VENRPENKGLSSLFGVAIMRAMKLSIVLDGIGFPHNVGPILRIADAVQAEKVWLCGNTPSPIDHEGQWVEEVIKMAVGAETVVRWEKKKSVVDVLMSLKEDGYLIVALHQSSTSLDYRSFSASPESKIAIVLGNEATGISPEAVGLSDRLLEIPVMGMKDSLNVAVACAIAAYAIVFGKEKSDE